VSRIKQRLDLTRPSGGPIIRVRRRRRSEPAHPGVGHPPEEQAQQPLEQASQQEAQPARHAAESQAQDAEGQEHQPQADPAQLATKPAPPAEVRATAAQESSAAPEFAVDAATPSGAIPASEPEPQLARHSAPAPPRETAGGLAADTLQRSREDWRFRVAGLRTTGIFTVPQDTTVQLVVAVSSFADEEQTATVWIRRVEGDELETVFFRALTVPPGGAQRVTVDGLDGQAVVVDVQLSSDLLIPTATVTQFFPADGATVVLLYKSAGDFISV